MDEPTSPVVAVPDEPTRRSRGALKGIVILIVLAAVAAAAWWWWTTRGTSATPARRVRDRFADRIADAFRHAIAQRDRHRARAARRWRQGRQIRARTAAHAERAHAPARGCDRQSGQQAPVRPRFGRARRSRIAAHARRRTLRAVPRSGRRDRRLPRRRHRLLRSGRCDIFHSAAKYKCGNLGAVRLAGCRSDLARQPAQPVAHADRESGSQTHAVGCRHRAERIAADARARRARAGSSRRTRNGDAGHRRLPGAPARHARSARCAGRRVGARRGEFQSRRRQLRVRRSPRHSIRIRRMSPPCCRSSMRC